MSLSFDPETFHLTHGIVKWLAIVGIVAGISLFASIVLSLLLLGTIGPWYTIKEIGGEIADFLATAPRRVMALTKLTFLEAMRRKTLYVLLVFAVLFLFAGWFMSGTTVDPELQVKNYVSFVLRAISWLIMPVVLLLACWGLPDDIRLRSLHTVVTKPVRRHEIVLGRILGYCAIGAGVLALMGVVGYVWIQRQLDPAMRDQLVARVPKFGQMHFINREGRDKDAEGKPLRQADNTGDINMLRSFVEGNTKARAVWEFTEINPASLGDKGLVLESSFQSFRTHKGDIKQELLCQLTLVNQESNVRIPLLPFPVHEFRKNSYEVLQQEDGKLKDESGKDVDLANDLLRGGKLRIEAACLSGGQFLGMARPDLFIRLPDRPFWQSYFKSVVGIGLMMIMVIVLGVMSGCFLKGPIATILTAFVVVVGRMAHEFFRAIANNYLPGTDTGPARYEFLGRGPLISLYNIPTHRNPVVAPEDTPFVRVIMFIDEILLRGMWGLQHLFPNLATFDTTEYVANSFDIPWAESLLPNLAVTVGYCLPWILVGSISLKLRELEAK
jgi:hypothetical protein